MSRKFHPSPAETRRVSVRTIATETGMSRKKAARWLHKNGWWVGAQPRGFPPTYDARVIDIINAVSGREHRSLDPQGQDWLSDFLRGGPPHGN